MLRTVLPPHLLWGLGLATVAFFSLLFIIVNSTSPKNFAGCVPKETRNFFDPTLTAAIWQNQNIAPLQGLKNKLPEDKQKVLGIESQDKIIEINLAKKTLTAHQGDNQILETPVNIGKYFDTPVGEYSVLQKHLSVDLSGGSRLNQTYFYLPNVPYALYFNSQFAILGSYWSKSFNGTSGFGCLEVPLEAAETLFYWADSPASSSSPGTKVIITT